MRAPLITVLMDIPADHRFHLATLSALEHAAVARALPIDVRVVPTDTIHDAAGVACDSSGIVIGPGSPYRNPEGALAMVREARERKVPLVGT